MYQVGDLIVYGNVGVCAVEKIAARDSGEKDQLFYELKPLFQNCMISTPVHGDKVFMRPVISGEEAEQLIAQIPSIRADICHDKVMWKLSEYYESILKTHDCLRLVELTMSIHAKKQDMEAHKRKLGAIDERFLHRAEDLLFGELSVALDIPKDDVQCYIAQRVSAAEV